MLWHPATAPRDRRRGQRRRPTEQSQSDHRVQLAGDKFEQLVQREAMTEAAQCLPARRRTRVLLLSWRRRRRAAYGCVRASRCRRWCRSRRRARGTSARSVRCRPRRRESRRVSARRRRRAAESRRLGVLLARGLAGECGRRAAEGYGGCQCACGALGGWTLVVRESLSFPLVHVLGRKLPSHERGGDICVAAIVCAGLRGSICTACGGTRVGSFDGNHRNV